MMAAMPGPESRPLTPALDRSLSFAPPHPSTPRPAGRSMRAAHRRRPGPPGRPAHRTSPERRDGMNGFPIQPAKVQGPPLRDETLARDRLLDWLDAKIHHRVILVIADAGYGKTTLLADFSRRTRVRTLWYRLDDDDRDWVIVPEPPGRGGPRARPGVRADDGRLLERPRHWAARRREAAIDDVPPRAAGDRRARRGPHPRRLPPRRRSRPTSGRSPASSSRVRRSGCRSCSPAGARPPIPLARLRALGEVAEIGTDDLRFEATETERLFRETYGRASSPTSSPSSTRRTEGWAASLQLVRAALRDRSPAEIRALRPRPDRRRPGALRLPRRGGRRRPARGPAAVPDADLDPPGRVSPDLAGVVDGAGRGRRAAASTAAAERLTLLSRPPALARGPRRYHPLVREFLEARLRSSIGAAAVAALHHRVAEAADRPRLAHRRLPLPRGRRPRGGRGRGRWGYPGHHVERLLRHSVRSSSTERPQTCVPWHFRWLRRVSGCRRATTRAPLQPQEPSYPGNRLEASEITLCSICSRSI